MSSNSGAAACRASQNRNRKYGVDDAVALIKDYPGIDSFTCAWIKAGGQYDPLTGQLGGLTRPLDTADLAKVLKVQARVQEAVKRGKVVVAPYRRVIRQTVDNKGEKHTIEANGYCLPGVTVLPLTE